MKASVLMSVYNETAGQVKESVASVLSQDYNDFELIVVLDKPERVDVDKILSSFNDKRIRLVKKEKNIGLAMSMNRAAELAQSSIYIRMDADDVCLPRRFKREIEIIDTGNYDFVFSNYNDIDLNSNILRDGVIEDDVSDTSVIRMLVSLNPSIIHHPTVLFTKDIFERAGGYRDFPCSQDSDLWLRMAEKGCRFYKLGAPYLNYRVNPNSVTNKRWYQQQLTCHYIFELSVQRLLKGNDSYSIDDYHHYLDHFNVNDDSAKERLHKAVDCLSDSASAEASGNKLLSLWLKAKVIFGSYVYRRHFYFLLRKKALLHS